jgi:nitrogen regulatory protein PII
MKELKAFVRVERADQIIHALERAGIKHMTITHVQAVGMSVDTSDVRISFELSSRYEKMIKLEIVCPADRVEEIMRIIKRDGHTGRPGDGIVYISSVDSALKIRSGELDLDAIV